MASFLVVKQHRGIHPWIRRLRLEDIFCSIHSSTWVSHDAPTPLELTNKELVMQLSGSNTIRSGICDAYFRLVHQDDLTMSTSKGDSVWRHFLETEFAVRSLSIIKIFPLTFHV